MKAWKKRYGRITALLVTIIMLLSMLTGVSGGFTDIETDKRAVAATENDNNIINDICNLTGASVEEVLKLRSEGKNWDEIMEYLKNKAAKEQDGKREADTPEGLGLDKELIEKLKAEGFKEDSITEARMLVERVQFQLEEILSAQDESVIIPEAEKTVLPVEESTENKEADQESYRKLAGEIQTGTAVYLMLKLEKEFGSIEAVLDEYLLSLQLGIKLEDYQQDKESYEKNKSEKLLGIVQQSLITLSKIESKMLEAIQSTNKKANVQNESNSLPGASDPRPSVLADNPVPTPPVPEVNETRVISPAEEVLREINGISNNSTNDNSGMGR